MKKFTSIILAAIMLFAFAPTSLAIMPVRVVVDSTDLSPFGAFEGWGTSLCWWGVTLGGETEAERREFTKAFFDLDEGLGLNIVRYNIGAGDDPSHTHLNNGRGVPVWVDEDGSFNPDADPNQIAVLQDAVYYGADIVECFSNSPPYYLTQSGCSSGNFDKNENNISPENFGKFADYLATVVAYIQNNLGIEVDSLEPMNEPATDYWGYEGSQEGCHIDPEDHSALITAVYQALQNHNLENVAVVAADETNVDRMAGYISDYTDEALSYISRFNTHTYWASSGGYESLRTKVSEMGKKLYMSEVDGAYAIGTDAGNMGPALWLSKKIITDMNGLRPNAWICWQITGPAYYGSSDDNGYWYMSQYDLEANRLDLFKKYYAFAQYTKFIRPGDYILRADNDNVLCARNFETGKTVVVVTNAGKRDEEYEIDLSSFENLGSSITAYRTDKTDNLKEIESAAVLEGKVLKASIPVNSITTFVIENSSPLKVTSMGLSLSADASSCFVGDSIQFTANALSGADISYSASLGSVDENGLFTASQTGTAVVSASIANTDMSASRTVDILENGDIVRLVNLNSSLALQESGSGEEEYIQQGDNDSAYQYWQIEKNDNIITLTNLRSKRMLSDGGCTQWEINRHDGGYSLTNTQTLNSLDVFNRSVNEGDKVGTYEFGGGSNQLWNFLRGNPQSSIDTLVSNTSNKRLVPVSVDGTAPYGGSEDVTYEKAFDGIVTTHHDAWDGDNSYLIANMPSDKPVTLIRFYPREGFEMRMYGGKFYGVKDGTETLLYTVPNQLKRGWNEAYIKNETIYDQIIYRTPAGGLCNVAEIEFYNIPFTFEASLSDALTINLESYKEATTLTLTVAYRDNGCVSRADITHIPVGEYASQTIRAFLKDGFESAEFYLTENDENITGGYIYLY